jgi:hypothetical protein
MIREFPFLALEVRLMNVGRMTPWVVATLLLPLALGGAATMAGPIGLIDDYSDTDLSEYTLYKVLDQGAGTTNIAFSSPSGELTVTSVGTTGAEQVLFLRSDHSLGVGEELQVDGPSIESGASTEDFGLAVGETPTSLGDPQAGDNRNQADFLFISYRNPTQLNSRGFNNGAEVGQDQEFGVTATQLFIARTATDEFELGWYDGATRNIAITRTGVNADMGSNVGFYADLRADGAMIGNLDNLRIVPEPSGVMLAMLALAGLVGLGRRRD